jgi:Zn-finger nucleic acid-binding protein
LNFDPSAPYLVGADEEIIMKCPMDSETLVMTERSGVEIDYCPKCRGVWLDRGELDKIIAQSAAPSSVPAARPKRDYRDDDDDGEDYRRRDDERGGRPRRRRESFLEDLFDF